jgi:hypothetical protein
MGRGTFPRQIRSVLGASDVSLMLVIERETGECEVRAVYEREEGGKVERVAEAERIGGETWASLRERRHGVEV